MNFYFWDGCTYLFDRNLQMENPDSDILPSPELMQDDLGINIGKEYEVIPSAGLEEKQCEDVATDQSDTTEDSEGIPTVLIALGSG